MKMLKVCNQLRIGRVGEEEHHSKCLHEISMSEDNNAAAWFSGHEPMDRTSGTIEKRDERLGFGPVGECGVFPLPVRDGVGLAVQFAHAPVERRVEKAELLDRPLFDGHFWEPLPRRLSGLLRTQKW